MHQAIMNWALALAAALALGAAHWLEPSDFETAAETEHRAYLAAAQACRNAHRTEAAPEWDETNQQWVCVTRRGEVLAYQQPGARP